ncbi:RusA family crossover junction endodeoxyribonuclease [Candidatus Woesearchaeota archaeon]|nr:RusA family crossover junction endodeoxyribonuclease [Candidatus Woesearchaeota archaeon]
MELFLGIDRRLSDVDNLAKCLLDQMQGVVYDNDKIVRHIDILRNETSKGQITIIIAKYI